MAAPKIASMEVAPLSVKTTPEDKRVKAEELELIYRDEPTVFNSVNKVVELIMATDRELIGSKESVDKTQRFLNQIGSRGGQLEWEDWLRRVIHHQCMYGRSFSENIFNKSETKLLDLDIIDPKKMDYAKTFDGKILLDSVSNPVGYVETLPQLNYTGKLESDPIPDGLALQSNQIFFKPERIAHFKMYTYGDGFYGLGLIEPVYQTAINKIEMEKALTNVYLQVGFPTRIAKIGDQFHEPTEQLLESTKKKLQDASYRSTFAIPHYVDMSILEPKRPERLKEHLVHFVNEIATGIGVPKAIATGVGEETNRATLNRQEYIFKLTLRGVIKRTSRVIEKQIFTKFAELEGLKDVPRLKWGEIALEEMSGKAERLTEYAKVGLLTPNPDTERFIRKSEGLPVRE
jgi:hypothetical protein